MNGTIKKVTKDRGFGFITAEDGVEYFFHQSELRGGLTFAELREGQRVSFEVAQSDKGPRAAEVHPA
jgi:CspA family cold shock protein